MIQLFVGAAWWVSGTVSWAFGDSPAGEGARQFLNVNLLIERQRAAYFLTKLEMIEQQCIWEYGYGSEFLFLVWKFTHCVGEDPYLLLRMIDACIDDESKYYSRASE